MKKLSGILVLLAVVIVLAGCKTTGQAYYVNDDLTVSGKTGIGTTSPGSKLDVVGGDEVMLRVTKTASGTPAAIVSGGYIIMDGGAYGIRGGIGQGMYLGANNADIIYISTQGNVGIGTTSPAARLEITSGGNPNPNLQINSAEGRGIRIDKTGGGETLLYLIQNDAYENNFLEAYGGGETPLLARINGLGGAYFAGNVGIGTTGPSRKLHIKSVDNDTPAFIGFETDKNGMDIGINPAGESLVSTAGQLILKGKSITLDGGNVGIGTTNPQANLHINGNMAQSYNQLILESVDSHASLMLKTDTNSQSSQISFADKDLDNAGWIVYSHASDSLKLGVNQGGAELTLSKNGNVGIGTASPTARLSVKGDNSGNHIFNAAAINGPDALTIYSDGNIYIGAKQIDYGAKGAKLKMMSLSGDYWCCGPNNAGVWSCTATKGSCY